MLRGYGASLCEVRSDTMRYSEPSPMRSMMELDEVVADGDNQVRAIHHARDVVPRLQAPAPVTQCRASTASGKKWRRVLRVVRMG